MKENIKEQQRLIKTRTEILLIGSDTMFPNTARQKTIQELIDEEKINKNWM